MNESTQRNGQPEKMAKWKTALIVIAVIAFFLWIMANDDGSDEYCRSGRPGSEWGC